MQSAGKYVSFCRELCADRQAGTIVLSFLLKCQKPCLRKSTPSPTSSCAERALKPRYWERL